MADSAGSTTVELGQKVAMPLVGLGTWQMTGARCQAAVRAALEVGYRHIDTATMYRNEREVGRAVRDSGVPRGEVLWHRAGELIEHVWLPWWSTAASWRPGAQGGCRSGSAHRCLPATRPMRTPRPCGSSRRAADDPCEGWEGC